MVSPPTHPPTRPPTHPPANLHHLTIAQSNRLLFLYPPTHPPTHPPRYHVVKGRKVFFLFAPTDQNLSVYEKWVSSKHQQTTFFGNLAEGGFWVEVKAGQTFLLPSGN